MESLLTLDNFASFVTLSLLEIVLGIDNLIFITLVADNLPAAQRRKASLYGLSLAFIIRIAMLLGVSWIMTLTNPVFTVMEAPISVKDMLMIAGGGFLIAKSTLEMHADLGGEQEKRDMVAKSTLRGAVIQIALIDFVFSFDSIITAVGLTPNITIIVAAVSVSMAVMLLAAGSISRFLTTYPTFKMLALSFILMIGTLLVAEGLHFHVPKGYIYFAFSFSIFVEGMNTLARRRRHKPKP